jgi:hypothetical protein
VAVEGSVRNLTFAVIDFSTVASAELTTGAGLHLRPQVGQGELPSLDGTIQPRSTRRGWIVFEVPDGATGLRLKFRALKDGPSATFRL